MPAPKDPERYKLFIQRLRSSHLGYKPTKEAIEKMRIHHLGKKSHFYIDGRDSQPGHRDWVKNKRNRVLKRINVQGSSHSFGEWETLKAQYNWTCPACGRAEPQIKLTEDHIIPLSKGGSDNLENIQPLCKACNCKKHSKIIKF